MVVIRAQFRTSLLHRVKEEIEAARPRNAEWDFLTDLEYLLVTGKPYADWARKWVGTLVSPHLLWMLEEDADRRVRGVKDSYSFSHAVFQGPWIDRQGVSRR